MICTCATKLLTTQFNSGARFSKHVTIVHNVYNYFSYLILKFFISPSHSYTFFLISFFFHFQISAKLKNLYFLIIFYCVYLTEVIVGEG